MDDVITNQPVVIDNGSGMIKAGFAGDASPKCRFYNYTGRPKHTRCMAGALEGDVFIGNIYNYDSIKITALFRPKMY